MRQARNELTAVWTLKKKNTVVEWMGHSRESRCQLITTKKCIFAILEFKPKPPMMHVHVPTNSQRSDMCCQWRSHVAVAAGTHIPSTMNW